MQEFPEHVRELRVPVVVLAIDLFTALGQVMFQVSQIRRLRDLAGHLFCFLNYLVKLPAQSSVEGFAGGGDVVEQMVLKTTLFSYLHGIVAPSLVQMILCSPSRQLTKTRPLLLGRQM